MKKTPVSAVQERFQSKDKLVAAVEKLAAGDLWLDRVSSAKGLAHVANSKLLRLHDLLTDAKSRFGSRAKLIDAILDVEKRGKDAGYKQRLEGYPLPRLLDMHGVAARSAQRTDDQAKAKADGTTKKRSAKAAPVVAKKVVAKKKVPIKNSTAAKKAAKKRR